MNFDWDVSCLRDTLADVDMIDKDFDHFTGKVVHVSILFDQLMTVVANFNFFFDFCQSLLCVCNSTFQSGTSFGKVF